MSVWLNIESEEPEMAEFVITDESCYMAGIWGGVPNVDLASTHRPEYHKIPYTITDRKALAKRLYKIERRLLDDE